MHSNTPSEEEMETVARAIYEARGFSYDGRTIGSDGPYGEWQLAITSGRAAISALDAHRAKGAVASERELTPEEQARADAEEVAAKYALAIREKITQAISAQAVPSYAELRKRLDTRLEDDRIGLIGHEAAAALADLEQRLVAAEREREAALADFHGMQDGSLLRDERAARERVEARAEALENALQRMTAVVAFYANKDDGGKLARATLEDTEGGGE